MTTSNTQASQPIVFILDNVVDAQSMADGLYANHEVHVLSSQGDALAQMASILDGRSNVEAIHLVSHGQAGALDLGTVSLTASNLADHGSSLSVIRGALAQDADFLIYGCDVAQGPVGAAFVEALADATGADVAASDDVTGPTSQGGDATLEYQTGSIEATALDAANFQSALGADGALPAGLASAPYVFGSTQFQVRIDANISDADDDNAHLTGSNADRYDLSNIADGTVVSVYMGNSDGLNDMVQIERGGSVLAFNDDGGEGQGNADAFLSWNFLAGDILVATTAVSAERGSYSLFLGASTGPAPVASIQGPVPQVVVASPSYAIVEDGNGMGWTDSGGSLSGTLTLDNPGSMDLSSLTYSVNGPVVTDDSGNQVVIAQYGTLYLGTGSGSYNYVPNAVAINALGDGEQRVDSFTFNAVGVNGDITSGTFSFNVQGSNDAPVVVLEVPGATMVEAGGLNNGQAGVQASQIAVQIADAEGAVTIDGGAMWGQGWSMTDDAVQWIYVGQFGIAGLEVATGTLTYTLDDSRIATQALTEGQAASETFVVHVVDASGAVAQASTTFAITGTDDVVSLHVLEASTPATYIDSNGQEQININRMGYLNLIDVDTDMATYGDITYGVDGGFLDDGGNSIYTGDFGVLVVNSWTGQFNYVGNAQAMATVEQDTIAYDTFNLTMSNGSGLLGSSSYEVEIVGQPAPDLA